jgi:E1A-binding protein p400
LYKLFSYHTPCGLQVLAKAEDETDVQAADLVKAEQKAELAEFDENIPWDEREAELKKEEELSKVEQEIAMLDKEVCLLFLSRKTYYSRARASVNAALNNLFSDVGK